MENFASHSFSCASAALTRVHRHDLVTKIVKSALTKTCDRVVLEPRPPPSQQQQSTAAQATRPDLKVERRVPPSTNGNGNSEFETHTLCEYDSVDVLLLVTYRDSGLTLSVCTTSNVLWPNTKCPASQQPTGTVTGISRPQW